MINLFCEDVYMYITPYKMHTITVLCGCDIDFHCFRRAVNYL